MKRRTLNLDSEFVPVPIPEIRHELLRFSGGEMHIKLKDSLFVYDATETVIITHRINNMDNLMEILLAKDALERKGIKKFDLIIPYIPYARQDKVNYQGEAFSLKVFADILNAAKFDKVYFLDAHSIVTPALIHNSIELTNEQFVRMAYMDIYDRNDRSEMVLISPDAGASKKAHELMNNTEDMFVGVVQCGKVRSTKDGSLSGFEVYTDNLNNLPCLIVDDICDGGGTFLGLAEKLKEKNAGDLYLFVSHGIFARGVAELSKVFKKIYTTDSINQMGAMYDTTIIPIQI